MLNYWNVLEIKENSSLKEIKLAFLNKYFITKHLINNDNYNFNDLLIIALAYVTLSNASSYYKYLYNLYKEGYLEKKGIGNIPNIWNEDLLENDNISFVEMLEEELKEYKNYVDEDNIKYDYLFKTPYGNVPSKNIYTMICILKNIIEVEKKKDYSLKNSL